MNRKALLAGITCLILTLGISQLSIFAQSNEIILTVAIEEWQQDTFNNELFDLFEAEHPNVKVVPVILSQDERFFGRPYSTEQEVVDEYLQNVQNFASIADILPVESYNLDIHATRTGSFLDLSPLIAADPNANLDDFYPAVLQSFQWDGATWGLPLSSSIQLVVYNQTRFDEIGLPYPDETWTINDYVEIGRQLTTYDDSGAVELPGFFGFDSRALYRIFLGHSITDETIFPSQPQFVDQDLINIMGLWSDFVAETTPNTESGFNFDFNEVPMTITGLWRLDNNFGSNANDTFNASLLPGGTAALQVQGYSISAGTPHPEMAYELLQWMTNSPDVVNRLFGDRPARRRLYGAEGELESNVFFPERSDEVETLIDEAYEVAIPTSELHFFDYLYQAEAKIADDGIDAEQALQETQQDALDILAMIEAGSQNTFVAVATPIPTPVLGSGEISLNFGYQSFILPMPNRDTWITAISDFAAQDSEVRHIEFTSDFMGLEEQAETQDCFVLNSNPVLSGDVSLLLPIDPFLSADPNFDPSDLITGALQQMTSSGNVYGYPLSIQPHVIWYNQSLFEEAGVREPYNGWTVSDFEGILREYYTATGDAAYTSQGSGNTYILQLIAAYGGYPIDYTTEPYTYNLTDTAFIQAAEQVLGLAKAGYIDYQELATFGGGGGFGGQTPMFDSIMRADDWRIQNRSEDESGFNDPYQLVTFPIGRDVTPVSYDLGGAYISAQSLYPEACYRWITFLSERPELLASMPARRSMIEPAAATIANGDDILALYQEIDNLLQTPNVLVLPGQFSSFGSSSNPSVGYINFIASRWMNAGFDAYVLDDADLATEMQQAKQFIEEFAVCADSISAPTIDLDDMTQDQITEYFDQFQQCAVTVDPAMADFFGN